MSSKPSFSASVQEKNGRLYAVIQYRVDGKSKPVWRSLGLDDGAPQAKIKKAYREVVGAFEEECAAAIEESKRPKNQIPIYAYCCRFLENARQDLQVSTYAGYSSLVEGRIKDYFAERESLTVGNLRPTDIHEFYDHLLTQGLSPNTVIHYHVFLHRAFRQAFEDELIDVNPFDRAKKPKRVKFQGDYYNEEELRALIEMAKTDPIYPVILIAGGMGLRRSEAIGVRWSRINWNERTVLLDTKIIECKDEQGHKVARPFQKMKNASSCRTLSIPEPVYEMLLVTKEQQLANRKRFKGSYNRDFLDYVCTDPIGNLIRPDYVTQHFPILLNQLGLRKIRFHDLRHTFASLLLAEKEPLINVSRVLGHSSISTTANIYAHLDQASKKASADIITGIFRKENRVGGT